MLESNSDLLTSEIAETVSEEITEEINTEETEIFSEEASEISTEEIFEVETSETSTEIVVETVVYTTDPVAVKSLQIIVCILCLFLVYGICKVIYKFLDSIFII